ncbi:3,4-dihydroxy-2-butanone-4-phosphate synthase [Mycolicibacterium litorale]|uniref:3,4-dihydroxy-2-butanone-4-phosphate synthase n=1 Tax=Mycolicibacterium litorale TaxID=758802 RepID=UPI003CE800A5
MSSIVLPGAADELAPVSRAGAARIARARTELARGRLVVLSDESECTLVLLGSAATTGALAQMIRDGSGLIFAAVARARLEALRIPRMTPDGAPRTAQFHVAVDAADGVGTGISAADRAHTLRLLSNPAATGTDFARPGHVIPVAGDLTPRLTPGTCELALALASLADPSTPVAAYCALTSRTFPHLIADPDEGAQIAARDGMAFVDRDDVLGAIYR